MARTQGIRVRDGEPEMREDIAPCHLNGFPGPPQPPKGGAAPRLDASTATAVADRRIGGRGEDINLPFEVLRDGEIMATFLATVRAAGIPESRVIFELTEASIYDSSTEALAVLARLGLAGFGRSADDGARRQSGLLQVEDLTIIEVKTDVEIRAQTRRWTKSCAIFGSIAELGRRLRLCVVAEGVETRDDLALVRRLPVDYVQGFLVSRKRLLPDLLAMLAACPPHVPLVSVDNAAFAP